MSETIIGIIDAQRGFMPASEAARTARSGFGELPVPDGEQILAPVQRLLGAAALHHWDVFTTQDWHPYSTAHFAEKDTEPNFTTTWPVHCVNGTPGAELHPELQLPGQHVRFVKGDEMLVRGEDDTSYSAYYAHDPTTGHRLPEWLSSVHAKTIVLGGLALDYCVGKSALDLKQKTNLNVIVAVDASRGIAEASTADMLDQFKTAGVQVTTTDAWLEQLQAA